MKALHSGDQRKFTRQRLRVRFPDDDYVWTAITCVSFPDDTTADDLKMLQSIVL